MFGKNWTVFLNGKSIFISIALSRWIRKCSNYYLTSFDYFVVTRYRWKWNLPHHIFTLVWRNTAVTSRHAYSVNQWERRRLLSILQLRPPWRLHLFQHWPTDVSHWTHICAIWWNNLFTAVISVSRKCITSQPPDHSLSEHNLSSRQNRSKTATSFRSRIIIVLFEENVAEFLQWKITVHVVFHMYGVFRTFIDLEGRGESRDSHRPPLSPSVNNPVTHVFLQFH